MNEITHTRRRLANLSARVIGGRITADNLYTASMANSEQEADGTVSRVQYWVEDQQDTIVFQAVKDAAPTLYLSVLPADRSGKAEWAQLSSPRASKLAQELLWYAESKL